MDGERIQQHIDKQGTIAGTKRDEIPSEVGGTVKDSRKNCSLKAPGSNSGGQTISWKAKRAAAHGAT